MPGPTVLLGTTDEVHHLEAFAEDLLGAAERERADRFRSPGDRRDFVAAHVLVRLAAAALLGVAVGDVPVRQECEGCGGPHGRPEVPGRPDVYLSLAHTRGVVAAAAGRSAVGVDLERIARRPAEPTVHERVLTAAERDAARRAPDPDRAFLRQWVRKESLVKVGRASLADMAAVDLSHLPSADAEISAGPVRLGPRWPDLWLLDWVDEQRGVVGAVVSEDAPAAVGVVGAGRPAAGRATGQD